MKTLKLWPHNGKYEIQTQNVIKILGKTWALFVDYKQIPSRNKTVICWLCKQGQFKVVIKYVLSIENEALDKIRSYLLCDRVCFKSEK